MTQAEAINKVIKLAESEVGYKAGANKWTKYGKDLDAIGDFYNFKKNGYNVDWCEIFVDWLFVTAFSPETGRKMIYQPKKSTGAGCGFSAGFYRQNNAWSKNPTLGAQIYYGPYGNESHTGIVVKFDATYVWTVEGNTGGGVGQVQKKKLLRKNSNIAGYGIPNWKLAATNTKFTKQWGIDISAWQGDYNLQKAKSEGVKFVILKGGGGDDGLYKDSRFEQNYNKAKSLGLPVGVYWFSRAMNTTQAKSEAEFFYQNCLKGKQFELPIYIDVEAGMLKQSKRSLTDCILTWLKYVRNAGYWVGIYSSTSAFASLMYDDELKGYAHWVADWRGKCYYPNYYGMWQFGGETNPIRSKKVAGQTTDQNYMYEDYPTEIKAKGLNGWGKTPTPTPTPVDPGLTIDGKLKYADVLAMQKWLKTYEDGVISGQLKSINQYYPNLIAVEYGTGGSACIKALQKYLNTTGAKLTVDGIIGKNTVIALQKFLKAQGNSLEADGILGPLTAKALQKYLNKVVYGK